MEQYEGVKARYPGHLVLFRVGDFYETFGDDAKLLARELEVVLTARAPDGRGERMPMAGVPHHAVETYLGRLVRKGYKVALCDQVEDARFAKGLVRREVTRVVTPGTAVEERILPGPDHNFLASIVARTSALGGYAVVDVTTGEWFRGAVESPGVEGILAVLAPFQPREILVALDNAKSHDSTLETALRHEFPHIRVEPAPEPLPPGDLPNLLASTLSDLSPVQEAELRLAAYVRATQPRLLPYLELVPPAAGERRLVLDLKTLRHLEISRPMNPDDPGGTTLLDVWDETVTAPGRRTLAFWLKNPLANVPAIVGRQDAVEALVLRGAELLILRSVLSGVADLSRIASRLAGRRVHPPELGSLRDSLALLSRARDWLGASSAISELARLASALEASPGLITLLRVALPEELSPTSDAEDVFRQGYSPDLDRLVADERAGLADLEALERSEQEASGIRSLRIGYNQVFGYYFEISRAHLEKVPAHFRRKQTLSGTERFTSERLDEVEARILSARDRLRTSQGELWEKFLSEVERFVPSLHQLSRAAGQLDALAAFALLAQERSLIRPTVDDSTVLIIRDGRHPVLDRLMSGQFVPNDTELDSGGTRLMVLTGPNMSGKSTYMRQVGLLVLLAQAGSFVPARFARIGRVDALFTRMGFTDEIGRGKSSFMVEMTEVAEIVRAANDRSLVLLDEVGRGTSTFDGLAIAWATLRHLHDRSRSRTLLATHYHQLTELIEGLPGAANAHLAVDEREGEVVFLHRIVPGSTDRSYGIHVARLAGLPGEVIQEAERLLKRLETEGVALSASSRSGRRPATRYTQAMLLSAETETSRRPGELERALTDVDLDRMSPVEALQWMVSWRSRLGPVPPSGDP